MPTSKTVREITERMEGDHVPAMWYDWKWQVRHAIRDIDTFEHLLDVQFPKQQRCLLDATVKKFPLAITPYYLSLIDRENLVNDPIFKQSFPSPDELRLQQCDMADPLAEDQDSPAPGITHRYPDRVLFHVSNVCAMYCRHCTRKRKVGDHDFLPQQQALEAGLEYIRNTPVIRDVLLSGGDPFLLSDQQLDWLLQQLRSIAHVEVVRIGTRTPVVLPYRITDALITVLRKYNPLWINTHFNHPRELTSSSRQALGKLADAGFPLGNQNVLLAGVNDCPRIIKHLVQKLVANRVRPYYMYQCDLSEGLTHFRTPVGKGIEIMENLIGHTSGFAVPTYVIDAPGGGGKIPVTPNYLISWGTNKVVLRNYEGVITTYKEPDGYKAHDCNRDCVNCRLQLKVNDAEEHAIGISKLLCNYDQTIALIPEDNERHRRRQDDDLSPALPQDLLTQDQER